MLCRKYSLDYAKAPTNAYSQKLAENMKTKAQVLQTLLDRCAALDISTDYETLYYSVLDRFFAYMQHDISLKDYRRVWYTYEKCAQLYEKAKGNLAAYLDGSKTPFEVPRYVTSDIETDGVTLIADTKVKNVTEKRPVYFNGYGHFATCRDDIENFQSFGGNCIQQETGPAEFIFDSLRWSVQYNYSKDCSSAEVSTQYAKSGTNSLKITYSGESQPNCFTSVYQTVAVKPDTTYYYGASVKADSATNLWMSPNNWSDRNESLAAGTFNWRNFGYCIKTGANETSRVLRFTVEGPAAGVYIDDFYFCEGSRGGENLLKNPGFENGGGDYSVDPSMADSIYDMLKRAEKSDIYVDLLISPHYFPNFITDKYPEIKNPGSSINFNISSPIVRSVICDYLNALLPRIKDCAALKSICLTNEPWYDAADWGDYYKKSWSGYLQNKYKTIENLNAKYGEAYSSFDSVPLTKENDFSLRHADYRGFCSDILAEFHAFLADTVRELAPGIPIHAKVQWSVGSCDNGDERARWNMNADFEKISKLTDYNGNDAVYYYSGVKSGYMGPLYKSIWYDCLAGVKTAPIINSEDHMIPDFDRDFSDNQCKTVTEDSWQNAFHGRSVSQKWLWHRVDDETSLVWGSLLYRPDCIAALGEVNFDLNRLSYQVKAVTDNPAQIGILYSDTSRGFSAYHLNSLYCAYESMLFSGHKVKIILESQTGSIGSDIKMIIVPNAECVKDEVVNNLYAFEQSGGRVVIMGQGSLCCDEYNAPRTGGRLAALKNSAGVIDTQTSGMYLTSPSAAELKNTLAEYADECSSNVVRLVYSDSGTDADGIEYMYGFYNGNIVINVCNYDTAYSQEKTVKVLVNGKQLDGITELRSGKSLENIVAKPFEPMLLCAPFDGADSRYTATVNSIGEGSISVADTNETAQGCTAVIKDSCGAIVYVGQSTENAGGYYNMHFVIKNFDPSMEYTVSYGGKNGLLHTARLAAE